MARSTALAALVATMMAACGHASPRPEVANGDLGVPLREIGDAADGDRADSLARVYVERGPTALRAAAERILFGADEARDRGARLVLTSLERPEEFAFLRELSLEPRPDAAGLACNVIDLMYLVRQSVAARPTSERADERLAFEPAYAEMLVHVVDRSWPVCVRSCPTCETTRHRPQTIALEILDEMRPFLGELLSEDVPWSGLDPEPATWRARWVVVRERFLHR